MSYAVRYVWAMRFPFSRRPAQCDHAATIAHLQEQARQERQRIAAEKAAAREALIERLSHRYYLAHAVSSDMVTSKYGAPSHLIGVCSGIVSALAEVTGKSEISVGCKMERGIPVDADWLTVNDAPSGATPDIRLLHDGIREPITERLDMLHRAALKADGHPAYNAIFGRETATV